MMTYDEYKQAVRDGRIQHHKDNPAFKPDEELACGGSIAPTLKRVMESVPEFVLSKKFQKDFKWDESRRYRKSIPTPQNMPDSVAQHVSRVFDTVISVKPDERFTELNFEELEARILATIKCKKDLVKVNGSVTAYFGRGKTVEHKKDQGWPENPCPQTVFYHRGNIRVTNLFDENDFEPSEKYTFGSAVQKALTVEKSIADKAYDKFKKDEWDHITKLREVLSKLSEANKPATAYDLKTSMVIMWELLQKGYVEDVTPAARTGGAIAPDTTYCYEITSSGQLFIARAW